VGAPALVRRVALDRKYEAFMAKKQDCEGPEYRAFAALSKHLWLN
jgi:hypothetical protein